MRFVSFLGLLIAAACSSQPPADAPEPKPGEQPASAATAPSSAASVKASAAPLPIGTGANANCRLPAPKVSADSCEKDADCGVSAPCHAPACVGIANANPPKNYTMCTMSLMCETADANRCGCFEGHCALIPPAADDAAKP